MSVQQPPFIAVNARRNPAYGAILEGLGPDDCLLCEPLRSEYNPDAIVLEGVHWLVMRNRFPYENTAPPADGSEGHVLLLTRRHITSVDELTTEEEADFFSTWREAREKLGFATGALVLRYSDEGNQGAVGGSLTHVHWHILRPKLDPETGRVPGHGTPDAELIRVGIG